MVRSDDSWRVLVRLREVCLDEMAHAKAIRPLAPHPCMNHQRQAHDKFGIDSGPFLTLLDVREEKVRPKDVQPAPLFREYLKQIESVVAAVDGMEE